MTIPDWYLFLNYKLIDTSSEVMADYNWIYVPFNAIEALIWLFSAIHVFIKYRRNDYFSIKLIYAGSFFLFGISDIIELSATTPLLLLFKGTIILCLLICKKCLKLNSSNRI